MNTFEAVEIEEIACNVFGTMVNLPIERCEELIDPDVQRIVGMIQISGAWSGCVLLHLPCPMALSVAAEFLGMPIEEVNDADLREVAAELANMIGGNLKSTRPGPSYLSLPNVVTGREYDIHVPSASELSSVAFSTPFGNIHVSVYFKSQALEELREKCGRLGVAE